MQYLTVHFLSSLFNFTTLLCRFHDTSLGIGPLTLQTVEEEQSPAVESGPNGSERTVENLCRLLVAHLVQIAENDRLTVMFRQCQNRLANRLDRLLARQFNEWITGRIA